MKILLLPVVLFAALVFFSPFSFAAESVEEWQNTVLSDATIKKIQEAQVEYRKCVGVQMQIKAYKEMDSRKATDEIIKQCEPTLGKMREVYLTEKVPPVLADRHLRQMRIQITRKVLQEMMFAQASRGADQP